MIEVPKEIDEFCRRACGPNSMARLRRRSRHMQGIWMKSRWRNAESNSVKSSSLFATTSIMIRKKRRSRMIRNRLGIGLLILMLRLCRSLESTNSSLSQLTRRDLSRCRTSCLGLTSAGTTIKTTTTAQTVRRASAATHRLRSSYRTMESLRRWSNVSRRSMQLRKSTNCRTFST